MICYDVCGWVFSQLPLNLGMYEGHLVDMGGQDGLCKMGLLVSLIKYKSSRKVINNSLVVCGGYGGTHTIVTDCWVLVPDEDELPRWFL